jgi:hypothetical protein
MKFALSSQICATGFLSCRLRRASGDVHALDRFGSSLAGFPKVLHSVVSANTPAIADLDDTGHNVLIEWGQYMGAANHRGYYETGTNLPNDAFLTAQAHGAGTIALSDGGINCGATCIHKYRKGTSVTVTASPGPGATFTQWLGPCAGQGNRCTVTVNRYTAIAAAFASPVNITLIGHSTVTSSPAGINCPSVACTAAFSRPHKCNSNRCRLERQRVQRLERRCSPSANTCTTVIDAAKPISAQFVDHYTLTVGFTGAGNASVVSSLAGIDCAASSGTCAGSFPSGTVVTLTVTPTVDSFVSSWGAPGCGAGTDACQVTMNSDLSENVMVALKPVVSITVSGRGSVILGNNTCTSSCSLPVDPNGQIQLTTLGTNTTYFTSWGGDCW